MLGRQDWCFYNKDDFPGANCPAPPPPTTTAPVPGRSDAAAAAASAAALLAGVFAAL